MTVQEIEKEGYKYHHTASCRGYTRVEDRGTAVPYKGRFGVGYVVFLGPHYHFGSCKGSTNYQDIAYYVK